MWSRTTDSLQLKDDVNVQSLWTKLRRQSRATVTDRWQQVYTRHYYSFTLLGKEAAHLHLISQIWHTTSGRSTGKAIRPFDGGPFQRRNKCDTEKYIILLPTAFLDPLHDAPPCPNMWIRHCPQRGPIQLLSQCLHCITHVHSNLFYYIVHRSMHYLRAWRCSDLMDAILQGLQWEWWQIQVCQQKLQWWHTSCTSESLEAPWHLFPAH